MIEQKHKAPASTQTSVQERKELLGRHIASMVAQGFRVESQSDFQAVMVKGKDVNHILHLILSLVTAGIWLLVWLLLIATGGEKRSMITVDNFGNVSISKV